MLRKPLHRLHIAGFSTNFYRRSVYLDADGAVVAACDVGMDSGGAELRQQAFGNQKIVDAPAHVLLACAAPVAPPAVGARGVGVEGAEGVDEARVKQACHGLALGIGEAGVVSVTFGIGQVDFAVRHVHISADYHRFVRVQAFQEAKEVALPFHAVVQARQLTLAVGHVDVDKVAVVELESSDAALVVVLLEAGLSDYVRRPEAAEYRRARVAGTLGIAPVRAVALELEVKLAGPQFYFLHAESVGIEVAEYFRKAFGYYRPQAVDIPGY